MGIFALFVFMSVVTFVDDDIELLIMGVSTALGAGITVSGLWVIIMRWKCGGFGKIVAGRIISVLGFSFGMVIDGEYDIAIAVGIGAVILLAITRAVLGLKNTHNAKSTWEQLEKGK